MRPFKLLTTFGMLAIANGVGLAVVLLLFAKWTAILISLVVGVGGGLALLKMARRVDASRGTASERHTT